MAQTTKPRLTLKQVMDAAQNVAHANHYAFITPELFILMFFVLWGQIDARAQQEPYFTIVDQMRKYLRKAMPEMGLEETPSFVDIDLSPQMHECYVLAAQQAERCGTSLSLIHVMAQILHLHNSWAKYLLLLSLGQPEDFLSLIDPICGGVPYEPHPYFTMLEDEDEDEEDEDEDEEDDEEDDQDDDEEVRTGAYATRHTPHSMMTANRKTTSPSPDDEEEPEEEEEEDSNDSSDDFFAQFSQQPQADWKQWVTCINDHLEGRNPLIGREDELEQTIRILCRRDKNNPIHVGDPGVGKTALIYGLAARIAAGNVPPRLQGARIFALDMSTLVSDTQYRGEFEKRFQLIMRGLQAETHPIVYIDEIHTIVGAGRISDGSMDAANLLKPYLEDGKIRFVGATTHEEFNRHIAKHGALVRRFQTIDVPEPSIDEAIHILEGLQSRYESFHEVTFAPGAIAHAVRRAARFINDRRLPDKAIDLIDEAAAYRQVHPDENQVVSTALIDQVLASICKVESLRDVETSEVSDLEQLEPALRQQIFGQDEAIHTVTEAVLLSRAGLSEDNKPVASLLFVGPTGVGKTEVAKVLAQEMGVQLIRFDMSEYAEKHTVARLIGAPAGYVGYEDGGLLTDAVRRTPHCVLLLDEIEKAHPDIFNLLLQVMDNASLTDSQGRHTDFRHAVVIMTSNAGAQHAHQAAVGFTGNVTAGQAMLAQVKRTFKPEFINRLNATVVFNAMSHEMAQLILHKKVNALRTQLEARNVTLQLSPAAEEHLLSLGYTPEYGAREMERIVARELKPLLTRQLLFGHLKHGGTALVDVVDNQLQLTVSSASSPSSTPQPEA